MSAAHVLDHVTLTVVYNNYPGEKVLEPDWGFACVIEGAGKPILFDTGASGPVLVRNLEKAGNTPASIAAVVLSHDHWDHTSGLPDLLEANGNVTVFVCPSFPADARASAARAGADCVDAEKGRCLAPGIWSTGQLGTRIKEQAVFAATPEGLVVVTGCAHPGVVQMAKGAKEAAGELGLKADEVALVTGGFHMAGLSDAQIQRTIDELRALGVKQAAPSHCSGDRTRALFQKAFGTQDVMADLGGILTVGSPASQ